MLGAIIGDIVGSTRERCNIKTEDFELLPEGSCFTDDSVMTLAVAKWLMEDSLHTPGNLVKIMQDLGRKYPDAGYGGSFIMWLMSSNPHPYGSYGNGSAMRVSPVGLYANTLEEALELAKITASVTHNHPEGIKGALAIAACIWLKRHEKWCAEEKIKAYIEKNFGYDLSLKLEDLHQGYSFDVSCQGSVPIAIMAYLQRRRAEDSLRLAISMGGDSDTIGCMTASIADAIPLGWYPSTAFSEEIISKCRSLLTPELLEINDRFEAFVSRPLFQSYYLERNIFVGEYPGDKDRERAVAKIQHMTHFGVRHFIDLTEEGELLPYSNLLPQDSTYTRFPIPNVGIPKDHDSVERLIRHIKELSRRDDGYVYIHSWGGVGRTETIIACYLEKESYDNTMKILQLKYSKMPKSAYRRTPDTTDQENFIKQYISSKADRMQKFNERIKDCIRGSLMAGAAGDALGYSVEFLRKKEITSKYGAKGITHFEIAPNGKALVSDDTQMTLFTANGMLMGLTRGYMRGIGGAPEQYVSGGYVDWYYTQTGIKRPTPEHSDFHCTWLRDLREMHVRRAPGSTCLSACDDLMNNKRPQNNSKGCGGIMRVAPMGLLDASFQKNGGRGVYNTQKLAEAGAFIAKTTHQHPLGFLPAALMTLLISRVVPLTPDEVKSSIIYIVNDGLDVMVKMFGDEYSTDKSLLKEMTLKAVGLAHSNVSDADAIKSLGEGWVAEEAWAIALYCTIRHIDNIQDAIIASVNHDGDSDSTGAITGNIMGAIYGYEFIKKERMFCPEGKTFEETIELANIILALADDLFTGCTISEGSKIETPEQRQWYERYCLMKPVGLQITKSPFPATTGCSQKCVEPSLLIGEVLRGIDRENNSFSCEVKRVLSKNAAEIVYDAVMKYPTASMAVEIIEIVCEHINKDSQFDEVEIVYGKKGDDTYPIYIEHYGKTYFVRAKYEDSKLKIGDCIRLHGADYEVVQTIGRGSYGEVLKLQCKSRTIGNKLLKMLHHSKKHSDGLAVKQFCMPSCDSLQNPQSSLKSDEGELTAKVNFKRGYDAMAQLSHPNVAEVYDYFVKSDIPCFTMECIDGCNLQQYVERNGRLSEVEAKAIIVTICKAIRYCHEKGVYHGDLKPNNVMIAQNGTIKIIDFRGSRLCSDFVGLAWIYTYLLTGVCVSAFTGTPQEIMKTGSSAFPVGRIGDLACLDSLVLHAKQ